MTASRCLGCRHPRRDELDQALVAGMTSLRVLEAQFGVSKSSLSDHRRNHVSEALRRAEARARGEAEDTLLGQLDELRREAKRILGEARRAKDHGAALGALAALYKHIELLARFRPPPTARESMSVSVSFSPQGTRVTVDNNPESETGGPLSPSSPGSSPPIETTVARTAVAGDHGPHLLGTPAPEADPAKAEPELGRAPWRPSSTASEAKHVCDSRCSPFTCSAASERKDDSKPDPWKVF